jgi:cell division protease FtsH
MSEKLGPIRYGERDEVVFLGRQMSEHRNYSDKIAQLIDEEVHALVEEAHQRCHQILNQHWDKMELLVARLMEIETINAPEFEALMRGETNYSDQTPEPRRPMRDKPIDENRVGDGKRTDGGLDIGGTVPAPA